jgi:D-glycero-beta-D-manno-heptose 1-phosphate adenylyltransferase
MEAAVSPFAGVILDAFATAAWRAEQAVAGRTVVFTNGCFDLLHAGHVHYLAWARAQGDALIVGLNSDDSVRALKGPERPFSGFADRAAVLAGLRSVDVVVGFSERSPEVLLDRIAPDIHVKSAQYRIEELPERYVVESHGGRILLAPHAAGKSTTDIVARVRSAPRA